ncbi:uncharacterized protein T551_00247 [Pneumocystis jirovecii RU7]|uniref:Protein EFR3 n=1 Tax=Pneumocystis jirovecii (strain RU7) TaxID=1408657 RepID=A0A0W4ZWM3_PNEJ7|nr:uncharacterized protein T551_00247 [Pneumocystis jirovecii RU7]KTW32762.1 hypothetical protein T551_00247 [Pneumocystis jirovecii RU7]
MNIFFKSKHTKLILRCYPKSQTSEHKPNSSELSYLCYYGFTKPSKLPKVGIFLERKLSKDVYRRKQGDIIVSLYICKALIERCHKDLNLYAANVVNILNSVLRSGDVEAIEHSIDCFTSFISHHNGLILSSDENYAKQFNILITSFVDFAMAQSGPKMTRYRLVGMQAAQAITSCEAIQNSNLRYLTAKIIPGILHNLEHKNEEFLLHLQSKAEIFHGKENRHNNLISHTTHTTNEHDPLTDELNEILALENLKRIYEINDGAHIRNATLALISHIKNLTKSKLIINWAVTLITIITKWTHVQHRYIILIITVEMLESLPDKDIPSKEYFLLTSLIHALLSSNVNLIGLSVMDIIHALTGKIIGQIKELDTPDTAKLSKIILSKRSYLFEDTIERLKFNSEQREFFISELIHCLGALATHIYYRDQITDMAASFLSCLRPLSNTLSASANEVRIGKLLALAAVKEIFVIVNLKCNQSGVSRSRVSLDIWNYTAVILKDNDPILRLEYISVLTTFLNVEFNSIDEESLYNSDTSKISSSNYLQSLHSYIYIYSLLINNTETDYQAIQYLLFVLTEKFGSKETIRLVPVMLHLQESINEENIALSSQQKSTILSIIIWYMIIVSKKINNQKLFEKVNEEMNRRKLDKSWPDFITLHPSFMQSSICSPQPLSKTIEPSKPFLNKEEIIDILITTPKFPESAKKSLMEAWSPESSLILEDISRPDFLVGIDPTNYEKHSSPSNSLSQITSNQEEILLSDTHSSIIKVNSLRRTLTEPHINNIKKSYNISSIKLSKFNLSPDTFTYKDIRKINQDTVSKEIDMNKLLNNIKSEESLNYKKQSNISASAPYA